MPSPCKIEGIFWMTWTSMGSPVPDLTHFLLHELSAFRFREGVNGSWAG